MMQIVQKRNHAVILAPLVVKIAVPERALAWLDVFQLFIPVFAAMYFVTYLLVVASVFLLRCQHMAIVLPSLSA